jgi:hypothetical protein
LVPCLSWTSASVTFTKGKPKKIFFFTARLRLELWLNQRTRLN